MPKRAVNWTELSDQAWRIIEQQHEEERRSYWFEGFAIGVCVGVLIVTVLSLTFALLYA